MTLQELSKENRQQSDESLLRSMIAHYIGMHTKTLNENYIQVMATSFMDFIVNATAKFEKGNIEHGGSLPNRNLDLEIYNEVMDIFWYNEAKKWRKS